MSCVMLYWLEKKVHIVVHRRYIEMEMGMLIFLGFAIVGLILLVTGIVFLLKNIKWRKEKEERGLSQTINIVAIVLFSCMIFFGLIWMVCFGICSLIFVIGF